MAHDHTPALIGEAPALQALLRAARLVAATDVSVLILGESGTGKELLARYLHEHSPRRDRPLISINCAALPENLAESELFGHRKGAFTGAHSDQPGRIRAAEGGTLFLDEIGELPLGVQAKLLRFLEEGEIQTLGEPRPRKVDARLLAATNRDLHAQVAEGRFREDLLYRLSVVPLELPPLRERREDILPLMHYYLDWFAQRHGLPPPTLTHDAQRRLRNHSWPGNVRELRNLCERLVILLSGQRLGAENLPLEIDGGQPRPNGFVLPDGGVILDQLEADLIRQALGKTGGNRSRAARLLGLSRDTLLYRMKKYAIDG